MAGKNTAVFGIFDSRVHAERAIEALKADGFRNTDISILAPENMGTKDLGTKKETKASEGAAAGTSTGAVVGGTLGWLVGAGALFIPGVGPFIAAGPIMAALAGMGVGGALGGATGALVGAGIPEYVATRYSGLTKDGKVLLSVHCDSSEWIDRAKRILKDADAADVGSASETDAGTVKGTQTDKPLYRDHAPGGYEQPPTL